VTIRKNTPEWDEYHRIEKLEDDNMRLYCKAETATRKLDDYKAEANKNIK